MAVRAGTEAGQGHDDGRLDAVLALVVFAIALAVLWALVRDANAQGVLTGEEASVSIRDALSVPERFQFSPLATNFGGHVTYWAWSHLDPSFDLLYGRRWKALALALLAPLAYATLRRRLGAAPVPALVGALSVALMPGVAAFSWLATENGLEAVWGMLALLVATSSRRHWWLGGVVAGIAVSTYGGGLAWAAGVLAVFAVRVARAAPPVRRRDGGRAAAGALLGLGVVLFPKLWWRNTDAVVTGGGSTSDAVPADNLSLLWDELVDGAGSYYFFSSSPALGPTVLAVVVLVAFAAAGVLRVRVLWPWLVVAFVAAALYVFTGGIPGMRRAVALPVVAGLGVGVAAELVRTAVAGRLGRPAGALAAGVAGLAVVLTLALADLRTGDDLRAARLALPVDFTFPIAPGTTMEQQVQALADDLRTGKRTPDALVAEYEAERTLALIRMSAHRRGQSLKGIPDPTAITDYYFEGPRCATACRPAGTPRP